MQVETREAAAWWAQPRGEHSSNWIANYQRSVGGRQRVAIVDLVRELGAETLLEIGCHCGPNLVALTKALPTLEVVGIDVNAEAILAGQAWMAAEGLADRVTLKHAPFPAGTDNLPSGAFEVVVTCYSLTYLAPADLDAALSELGRLASRAVIMAEPMVLERQRPKLRPAVGGYQEWAHDYQAAIPWIRSLQQTSTRIVPITPPVDRLNAVCVVTRDGS